MAQSIRPVKTFVLRIWREPDAPEGDAYWRGLLRHLSEPIAVRGLVERPVLDGSDVYGKLKEGVGLGEG